MKADSPCDGRLFRALAAVLLVLPIGACASSRNPAGSDSHDSAAAPVPVVSPPEQRPAQEGLVDAGGAQLFYWDTGGAGEPVILLHAATGSAESWPYQQPVLADAGYRVIGYSRRGHYRSVSQGGLPPAHSTDLAQLMDSLNVQRAHLVATAAGAIVAADFAISRPDRVKSLVLATSLISFQDPLLADVRQRLSLNDVRRLPPQVLELSPSYRFANPDGTALWVEIERRARDSSAPSPRSANNVTFEALAATRLPILLIGGDADLYMPPAILWEIAARLPSAQATLIRNAGHSAYWEQPQAFNDAVLSFLSGHDDARHPRGPAQPLGECRCPISRGVGLQRWEPAWLQ